MVLARNYLAALLLIGSFSPNSASAAFHQCDALSGDERQACCTSAWAQCRAGCAIIGFPTQEQCETRCDTDYAQCWSPPGSIPMSEIPSSPVPMFPPIPNVNPAEDPWPNLVIPSIAKPRNEFWNCLGADGGWGEFDPNSNTGSGGGYIWLDPEHRCALQIGGGAGETTSPFVCCRIQINF